MQLFVITRVFLKHLLRLGQKQGMELTSPIAILDMPREHIERDFCHFKKKYEQLQLILIVLGRNDELYGKFMKFVSNLD